METTPDPRDVEFEAEVAALRRRFIAGLPARRAALVAAWHDCADAGDGAPWQSLRDVAHKLAGSAACYGLGALGLAARDLDRALSGRDPCRSRAGAEARVAQVLTALDAVSGTG